VRFLIQKLLVLPLSGKLKSLIGGTPIINRFFLGAFWLLSGTSISRAFSFFTSILIARILGKEDFGAYGIVLNTIGMFGLFAGLAMGNTITKYVAELKKRDKERAGRIITLGSMVSLLTGGVVAGILICYSEKLAESALNRPNLSSILISGSVLLFANAFNNVQAGSLSGFEAFKELSKINIVQGVVTPLISIPLVYFYGIQGGIFSQIIVSIIGSILCSIILNRECSRNGITLRRIDLSALAEWRILIEFSLPALISGILLIPVNWFVFTILVNQENGYGELGLFNAAVQWQNLVVLIPQILASVMLPIFSETYSNSGQKEFRNMVNFNIRLTWLIALPMTVIVIAFRYPISSIYGENYFGTAPIIAILMISSFYNIINNVVGVALAGSGRVWIGAIFNLLWAVAMIGFSFLLVPRNGGIGLSIAYMLSYFLHTIWQMAYMELKLAPTVIANLKYILVLTICIMGAILISQAYDYYSNIVNGATVILSLAPLFSLIWRKYVNKQRNDISI
jgi:O-antigen/teichoic acid export membrane protein